jgi:hypothetical protein
MQISIEARRSADQGVSEVIRMPNKNGAPTVYDFEAHNLTAYGGLLLVATMLEKLGFCQLREETLTTKRRRTRSIPVFKFILGMILARYVGFSPLNHSHFLKRDPMLTGILEWAELPPKKLLRPDGPIEHTYCDQLRDVQHTVLRLVGQSPAAYFASKMGAQMPGRGAETAGKSHPRCAECRLASLTRIRFSRIIESVFVSLWH